MTPSQFQTHLFQMLRIRRIEEALADRYKEQEMRCPMHLCIGQEAIAVGVCASLNSDDKMYSNHRAHGHYLAKGGDVNAMIAELYGRETGCCGGRGGSMHMIDQSVGFLGATPIVGGTVPLAVGTAWASSLLKRSEVTVIFLGDGCIEEGVVHESLNFAALHKLPILFVCENNDFSVYTPRNERQPDRSIYQIAKAHSISAEFADGNDLGVVLDLASNAIAAIRRGEGPQFLEFSTYRWREHCGPDFDDHLEYRNLEDVAAGLKQCPLERFKQYGLANGLLQPQALEAMEQSIQGEIDQAFNQAQSSRKPTLDDARAFVYAQ